MSAGQRPELNWQRCAELHNRLLEIGWVPVLEETDWKQDYTFILLRISNAPTDVTFYYYLM